MNVVDDNFGVDDLFMVMNSYIQIGDDIGGVRMYERCQCLCWWIVVWTYALLSHMFMHS